MRMFGRGKKKMNTTINKEQPGPESNSSAINPVLPPVPPPPPPFPPSHDLTPPRSKAASTDGSPFWGKLKRFFHMGGDKAVVKQQPGSPTISKITELANEFNDAQRKTIRQIQRGYKWTGFMYAVTFYTGIILILASLVFAIATRSALLPFVFAGAGALDIFAFFITKPPMDLQDSRADLCQLQVIHNSWFLLDYMWYSFIDEAYEYLKGEQELDAYKERLDNYYLHMVDTNDQRIATMKTSVELIEQYSESTGDSNLIKAQTKRIEAETKRIEAEIKKLEAKAKERETAANKRLANQASKKRSQRRVRDASIK